MEPKRARNLKTKTGTVRILDDLVRYFQVETVTDKPSSRFDFLDHGARRSRAAKDNENNEGLILPSIRNGAATKRLRYLNVWKRSSTM